MACDCDPVTSAPSGNCCILGSSVPSGQFVRWHVSEVANPAILVPAYQLGNATPTILPIAATQRFWVYSMHISVDVQASDLSLYWSIGGAPAVAHSFLFRGSAIAHDLRRYEGPAIPLPVNAELRTLSDVAAGVTVIGYGLLETI